MNAQELHDLLTGHLCLVPEPVSNTISRTYFHETVEWHPQRSTRVIRVLYEPGGKRASIQLCASSDNNNTVLIGQPFDRQALIDAVRKEVQLIAMRRQAQRSSLGGCSVER